MASQSLYEPLTCWHCKERHTSSQERCNYCNGYTLPTRTHHQPSKQAIPIRWRIFEIRATDSDQVKGEQLRSAATAIQENEYVAVLAIQFVNDAFQQNTKKTAVFLHRPGESRIFQLGIGVGELARALGPVKIFPTINGLHLRKL
jgi:hypothetical protein